MTVSNFDPNKRSFRREFNTEIAASESIPDLLRLMSSSLLEFCHRFWTWKLHVHCSLYRHAVTVSSVQRSFSKLKIIKTYLRSTISHERLDCLALHAIENEAAKQLNTDDLLDSFATINPDNVN